MLGHAWIILRKDMLQRLRDRTGLLVAFGVPLLIATVMGGALSRANEGLQFDHGVVAAPDDAQATAYVAWLDEQEWLGEGFRVHRFTDPAVARQQLLDEQLGAAIEFGDEAPSVLALQESVFAARASEGLVDRFLAERAVPQRPLPIVEPRSPGGELRMIDYFAASMSVLFLNFGVLAGVRALQEEKQSGALARLAAAPIDPLAVLLGKFSGLFAIGIVQMTVMIAATSLLFGTKWGSPLPVAALVVSTVFMAVGLTSLFMAWGGNAERGGLYAGIAIFVLAVVGGQFMPPQGLPEIYDVMQRLTPNGQAARAFVDLAAAGPRASLGFIAEPLLFTGAVGVVGLVHGVRRAHDALHRAAT
jgi:ABC-type multidrug transport system permease subunit